MAVGMICFASADSLFLGATTVGGQAPTVRLSYEGNPAGPLSGSSTGLLLTLETNKPLANAWSSKRRRRGVQSFLIDGHWVGEVRRNEQVKLIRSGHCRRPSARARH